MGCVAFCGRAYPFWIVSDTVCYTLAQIVSALNKKIKSYNGETGYRHLTDPLKEMLVALAGKKSHTPGPHGGGWGH
jgi:hypothetical protein